MEEIRQAQQSLEETVRRTRMEDLHEDKNRLMNSATLGTFALILNASPVIGGLLAATSTLIGIQSLYRYVGDRRGRYQRAYENMVAIEQQEVSLRWGNIHIRYVPQDRSAHYFQQVELKHDRLGAVLDFQLLEAFEHEHYLHNQVGRRLSARSLRKLERRQAQIELVAAVLHYGEKVMVETPCFASVENAAYKAHTLAQRSSKIMAMAKTRHELVYDGEV